MPEIFQGLGVFEWTILIAGVLLFCYSIHLAVDQRASLRFMASRQPATFVIAAVLAVLGIGSYVGRGMQPRDLVTACVLVAVGVSLAAVRAGMGSRGVYAEGFRIPWSRIERTRVEDAAGVVRVYFTSRGNERMIDLPDADRAAVEEFLRDMSAIHGKGRAESASVARRFGIVRSCDGCRVFNRRCCRV